MSFFFSVHQLKKKGLESKSLFLLLAFLASNTAADFSATSPDQIREREIKTASSPSDAVRESQLSAHGRVVVQPGNDGDPARRRRGQDGSPLDLRLELAQGRGLRRPGQARTEQAHLRVPVWRQGVIVVVAKSLERAERGESMATTADSKRGNAPSFRSQWRRRSALLRRRSEGAQRARRGAHRRGRDRPSRRSDQAGRTPPTFELANYFCALARERSREQEQEWVFLIFVPSHFEILAAAAVAEESFLLTLSLSLSLYLSSFDATTRLSPTAQLSPFICDSAAAARSKLASPRTRLCAHRNGRTREPRGKKKKGRKQVFRWPKW